VRDRLVGIHDFEDHLQLVDELIAEELREPSLLVNLKESRESHGHLLSDLYERQLKPEFGARVPFD
jgi:hypothetical protein